MSEAAAMAEQIHDATARFTDVLIGVDRSIWTARPPVGPWSLSEILEHVTIANQNMLMRLERALTPLTARPDITDDEMPYLFYSGEEPPNVAPPTGSWTDVDEGVERLRSSAEALIAWADATDLAVREVGAAHPVFGLLDGAQWLRFSAVHTWRHRTQLRAIRSHVTGSHSEPMSM